MKNKYVIVNTCVRDAQILHAPVGLTGNVFDEFEELAHSDDLDQETLNEGYGYKDSKIEQFLGITEAVSKEAAIKQWKGWNPNCLKAHLVK